MKNFDLNAIYNFGLDTGYFERNAEIFGDKTAEYNTSYGVIPYKDMLEFCDGFGLRVSAATIRDMQSKWMEYSQSVNSVIRDEDKNEAMTKVTKVQRELMASFRRSFKVELESLSILCIASERIKYSNDVNFDFDGNPVSTHIDDEWNMIFDKLPYEAKLDIQHAGKCYAYSEYTASAIHLCRAFECGMKEFVRISGIDINPPLKIENLSWEKLADCIKEHRDKNKTNLSKEEIDVLNTIRGQIIILKDQWRNPCAHSGGVFYDDTEVLRIYHIIKGLLLNIANMISLTHRTNV